MLKRLKRNELKRLKRKKAVGVDKFPSGMIKDAASVLAGPLTFLINMSIETGLVPSDWKIAKVIPVFKSGKNLTWIIIDPYQFCQFCQNCWRSSSTDS